MLLSLRCRREHFRKSFAQTAEGSSYLLWGFTNLFIIFWTLCTFTSLLGLNKVFSSSVHQFSSTYDIPSLPKIIWAWRFILKFKCIVQDFFPSPLSNSVYVNSWDSSMPKEKKLMSFECLSLKQRHSTCPVWQSCRILESYSYTGAPTASCGCQGNHLWTFKRLAKTPPSLKSFYHQL